MSVSKKYWDEKAKIYDKFDGKLTETQLNFLQLIQNFGINFKDKNVIDIGCGTGNFTLHIAKICRSILGVDSSEGMLSKLYSKLAKTSLTNVRTELVSFQDFIPKEKFDIAFLTMSGAVNENEFEKFLNLAEQRVYMSWEKPRYSSMLAPFFLHIGKKRDEKTTAVKFMEFLQTNNIAFKTEVREDIKVIKREFSEAFTNASWHLNMDKSKFDENELKRYLETICKDNVITDEITSTTRTLVF
ncbi:MAG: class I SAM-dependent methyltransferase [Campylobacter sp.]|nr:class I SAM-dependent methyltransferase [Campylobacter sp.]